MNSAKLSDILGIIRKIAPPSLAEAWDNSGLQLGDPLAEITRIMIALDATAALLAFFVLRPMRSKYIKTLAA